MDTSYTLDALSCTELLRLLAPEGTPLGDRLDGLVCLVCGQPDGLMTPIATPGNPYSTTVFVHDACPVDLRSRVEQS